MKQDQKKDNRERERAQEAQKEKITNEEVGTGERKKVRAD